MKCASAASAVFQTRRVKGEAFASRHPTKCNTLRLRVRFTRLPKGLHGFHIHKAGDLRGKGCKGACDHFHVGSPSTHGGPPSNRRTLRRQRRQRRHAGDLGNIRGPQFTRTYTIPNLTPQTLWGRSLIVHADPDDLGRGSHADSATTGHSGARIACAVFGRA